MHREPFSYAYANAITYNEEMQADHITPCSHDGRTVAENCQMLCRRDNALKSDR